MATCFNRRHHRQPQQRCDSQNKAGKKNRPTRWCTRICPMKNVPARRKPRDLIVHSFYPYQLSNADNFGDCKNCNDVLVQASQRDLRPLQLVRQKLSLSLLYDCTTVFEVNLKPSHVRTTHMLHVTLSSSRKAVAFCQHAQRNDFRRRDARPQSRWFAPRNPKLPPSSNSIPPC